MIPPTPLRLAKSREGTKLKEGFHVQSLFRNFNKLAGMTGTASTEADEFSRIYDLSVVEVPTNRPISRIDNSDVVFSTKDSAFAPRP